MTERIGNLSTATRRAISDDHSRDRLGEVRKNGNAFEAFDRLGRSIGVYPDSDTAVEAIRKMVAGR
jgi:hypothetical protein